MKDLPKVSIILGINKDNEFVEKAIFSILNQSYKNFDFYIIANNCNNDLFEKLKSFNDQRIKLYRTFLGQLAFNLNFAINLSDAKYIARMDSDDISRLDRIEKLVDFLELNPFIDVVGSNARLINQNDQIIGGLKKPITNKEIRNTLYFKNPFIHPTVMLKKENIINVGGYLGGRVSEDYGLWLRLSRDPKINFANIDEELLDYRIHQGQTKGMVLAYCEVSGLILTEFAHRPTLRKLIGLLIAIIKVIKAKLL